MDPNYEGVYVDPKDKNNLEVFTEREAFLQAAANVVTGFSDTLFEKTQPLLEEWIEHHEHEKVEIFTFTLTQGPGGESHSSLKLDPPTRPVFLSVPRSALTETFNFYDQVNGGAWRGAPDIRRFRRLNQVIRAWAKHFHIEVDWVIQAAECAALVALPAMDHPFIVLMAQAPPFPIEYFYGPFRGQPRLDPTRITHSELPAAALLQRPPFWNRRTENEASYRRRLLAWLADHIQQVEAFAAKQGERRIPRKRRRCLPPELRYKLAALHQCGSKSFVELEDEYKDEADWKESSDPGVAMEREVYRLLKLIGLQRRPGQ